MIITKLSNSDNSIIEAIQAYTAQGGQYAVDYPYTHEKQHLLYDAMCKSKYTTKTAIYRKVDLPRSSYEAMANELFENGKLDIEFDSLTSFTEEKTRAFTYGGHYLDYVIFRIPEGTTVNGDNISDRSIYPIEKEVLLGKNKFITYYDDLKWTSTDYMILTLKNRL